MNDFLAKAASWDHVAAGYGDTTAVELAPYAARAIALLAPSPDARVLDCACGPGTAALQLAPVVSRVDAIDFSPRMIRALKDAVAGAGVNNVFPHVMDGQALEFGEHTFDAALSMFGLMFFPNRARGFDELYRVVKPGGRAAVSTWGPLAESPAVEALVEAMYAAVPDVPRGNGSLSKLDSGDALARELGMAEFAHVEVHTVTETWEHASAASMWAWAERGSVGCAFLANQLGPAAWAEASTRAVAHLGEHLEFPAKLPATAYLGVGTKS